MITDIRFFTFSGGGNKWFAFQQMGLGRFYLKRIKGLHFSKLMGSGAGEGFSIRPDFSVYCLLTVWNNEEDKKHFFTANKWYGKYFSRTEKWIGLTMTCIHSRGLWDAANPFENEKSEESISGKKEEKDSKEIAVITRASIKKQSLFSFWRHVPKVSKILASQDGLKYAKGVGEWPLVELTTLSIWDNDKSMQDFAYGMNEHMEALKKARQKNWFKEDLFARFVIDNKEGNWDIYTIK